MSNNILRILTAMLLFLFVGKSGIAAEGEFNPENPPEPVPTFRVTVTATPAEYAYASGTGQYAKGTQVYISSSSKDSDYEFQYWEKDGQRINEPRSFYFTVEEENVAFTAVYALKVFNPDSPDDPSYTLQYPLYLSCTPEEACSFNLDNGTQVVPGTYVTVTANPSQGFVLLGWYEENGQSVGVTSESFNYEMPSAKTTLTARFKYAPESPGDPSSDGSQTSVSNPSRLDVNGDGTIDVTDATVIINWYLNHSEADYESKYDMNLDNVIDVTDATIIINEYLKK